MEGVQDFMDEEISGEKSLLDFFPSIFPPAPDLEFGKEGMNPLVFQSLEDHVFVATPSMNAVPERLALIYFHKTS